MAKSPTPIPAPPVKIQRDTNGAAPAAPAAKPKKAAPKKRRKRRRNPLLWFLHGLIRRIYFGLKTASRLVLLVPILVFMVAFSYNVDRSGLFQGALAPRRIVDLMLQGYDVTNFEQMDEPWMSIRISRGSSSIRQTGWSRGTENQVLSTMRELLSALRPRTSRMQSTSLISRHRS